jgi:DNA-binding winged helix-turn-helix (wHTH) protein/Flp pilus assembly protein TadD
MLVIGEWVFDPASRRLLAGQDERRLSPKAADVLVALAETPHQVWSRDALLERVWPNVIVGEEVLTHAIAQLRTSLGDDFRAPVFIETVYKRGYRLKCAVERTFVTLEDEDEAPGAQISLRHYGNYLEARDLFDRGGTRNVAKAVALFAAITEAEPEFAPAQVGMAKALAFFGTYYSPRSANLDKALTHCEAARRSDPRSAEAFAVQGFIHAVGSDFPRAVRNFKTAIRLGPHSSDVHYLLGRACLAELDVSLAAPMLERASTLPGGDYHSLMLAGKARQMGGDESRARSDFARAAALMAPRVEADPEDFRAVCGLSRCLVHLGRFEEASTLLERVRDHSDPMNYHLACTFARAGETGRALDILELVVEHGWNHRAWLDRDPDFDGLRQDRRFIRIANSIARH